MNDNHPDSAHWIKKLESIQEQQPEPGQQAERETHNENYFKFRLFLRQSFQIDDDMPIFVK